MKLLSVTLLMTFLCSCSHQSIEEYSQNKPAFDVEAFFAGELEAHGVIKNRSGKVTRYFTANISANWVDGVGTLEEIFHFNDGELQQRTWTLTPFERGYKAAANDVIGQNIALVEGNAMQLNYRLTITYKGKPLELSVEDWMWRIDHSTVLNESTLRKWGFKVGSIQLVIRKKAVP